MSELAEDYRRDQAGSLAELLGLEWTDAVRGRVEGRCVIHPHHLAPNGFLHAASVIALADTACGYGCSTVLPKEAKGFTTAELKANLLGTARQGAISCIATVVHAGRTTQVWDATVKNDVTGKTIGLFRCTQIVLY